MAVEKFKSKKFRIQANIYINTKEEYDARVATGDMGNGEQTVREEELELQQEQLKVHSEACGQVRTWFYQLAEETVTKYNKVVVEIAAIKAE